MGICFECRVTVDGIGQRRACVLPCAEGTVIETEWLRRLALRWSSWARGRRASPRRAPPQSRRRVLLVDDNAAPAARIWRAERSDPRPQTWPTPKLSAPNVCVMPRTTVFDAPRPGVLAAEEAALWSCGMRASSSPGAREPFLPFPGWTLPGVAQGRRHPGDGEGRARSSRQKRIVVAGSGPCSWRSPHRWPSAALVQVVAQEQAPVKAVGRLWPLPLAHPRKLRQGLGYRKAMNAPRRAMAGRSCLERRVEAVELSSG